VPVTEPVPVLVLVERELPVPELLPIPTILIDEVPPLVAFEFCVLPVLRVPEALEGL
jgi:hypothetical protein